MGCYTLIELKNVTYSRCWPWSNNTWFRASSCMTGGPVAVHRRDIWGTFVRRKGAMIWEVPHVWKPVSSLLPVWFVMRITRKGRGKNHANQQHDACYGPNDDWYLKMKDKREIWFACPMHFKWTWAGTSVRVLQKKQLTVEELSSSLFPGGV
jgi:hypothetical protein